MRHSCWGGWDGIFVLLWRGIVSASTGLGSRAVFGRTDRRSAHKDGASFHHQSIGLDVADDLRLGADLNAVLDGDVALHLSVHDDGAAIDLRLDFRGLANGERPERGDFPFDFPVDDEVILEADFALDFHVGK